MSKISEPNKLLKYLLNIFRSVATVIAPVEIKRETEQSGLNDENHAVLEAIIVKQSAEVIKAAMHKPVAFGILTASGHIAGGAVQNSISKENSDAQNPITLALKNLEDLKALPIKVDFKIAAVAVTVDICPLTGQPVDFDWGLYPDQLQLLADGGITEVLLVAPANGQSRYMPLDLKLCA
jgi:hypothetical protein